jgi:hypothetical protein
LRLKMVQITARPNNLNKQQPNLVAGSKGT